MRRIMKVTFVLTALFILFVANILLMTRGLSSEGFQHEGFASPPLSSAAGTNASYNPMGAYDGVKLPTGNNVSSWRHTAPNEKLMGAEFEPGPDSLFMFKNNQCKPECCGASFSCGGGCVCTTPKQRQYLAGRAGNRTAPEDSA
jgi:hypothetical protein